MKFTACIERKGEDHCSQILRAGKFSVDQRTSRACAGSATRTPPTLKRSFGRHECAVVWRCHSTLRGAGFDVVTPHSVSQASNVSD